jgi:L-malate glycosyltransferase
MKIGIAGPITTASVSQYLIGDVSSMPKGMEGAPFLGTLIATLIERGHEVSAYTLDRAVPDSLSQPIVAHGRHGFKIYYGHYRPHSFRFNGRRPGRILDFFRTECLVMQAAIMADKPDVVHAHWTYEFALAAIASERPYVVTCHDSPYLVLKLAPNVYRFGRYLMARSVFSKAKIITAVSPYLKAEIQKYSPVPITVVPNPLPTAVLGPLLDVSRHYGGERYQIAIILTGWSMRKNPEPALKAFAKFRLSARHSTLHLFGYDFGVGEKGHLWAKTQGIGEGMVFHGYLPPAELLQQLNTMHLLVHPAIEESFGMAVVEAMALGIPVIGGIRSGAVPWLLGQGSAGLLVDVTSMEAIYEAMVEILNNRTLYENYATAGIDRVRKEFHPAIVASKYEEIYRLASSSR